jgi:hypothetical protein
MQRIICSLIAVFAFTPLLFSQISPGASTPTYQLTNNYNGTPITLVTQPATLSSCPDGSCLSYQWQQSTNGTTWTDISGTTGRSYNPGQYQPTVLTYYRTKVAASGQTTVYSNIDTMNTQNKAINGPVDCWVGQTATYYYTGGNGQYNWSIDIGAGTIIGSYQNVGSFTVQWTNANTHTVTLDNNGNYITLSVYVHTLPINPGLIGKP